MNVKIDTLFQQAQIRLSELSVFNWGSFHGLHTASIDPFGTLVTGDNGAGKSTFVDGLMALLLPAGKATFNIAAAQGDRSDRSLISYMRGSFGSVHDGSGTRVKSKREKAVVTGLRALYKADDGSNITLASLFWTTQSTNALGDVKRIYIVARRNLYLKEVLDAFGEGNVRYLKQWLRDDPSITCCDDSFSDYQELYRKLLYMDNKNAPALLSRALGLKKIDNLTKLIRELVLEPSTVKIDAKKVVDEFSDLVGIHNQLIDAREQVSHLQRLPHLAETIENARSALDSLLLEKENLSIYLGEIFALLWGEKIRELTADLELIAREIKHAEANEKDAADLVERRHEEYLQLGGDKIEFLKKEIEHIKHKLSDVIRESSQYQTDAKKLDLSDTLEEDHFIQNQKIAGEKLENIQEDTKQSQDQFATVSAELSQSQQNLSAIADEIREIEARPDSNIDINYQHLRDELIDSLKLKPNELIFIGELVDVKDEERHWQGAIERALGGLRTTLLVSGDSYSMVTRWLNVRHAGLHVRVQSVFGNEQNRSSPSFKENGFLRKLVWREHPYREWLKHHLNKFDLQCVSGTEALDSTPFSMTQQGLVHMERGRFEKKDQNRVDDRRKWCLGFSNKSRLAILMADKKKIEMQLAELNVCVNKAREDMDEIFRRAKLWERIQSYRWEAINAPYWQHQLDRSNRDLQQLEKSGSSLEQAKDRWEQSKVDLKGIQDRKGGLLSRRGALDNQLSIAMLEKEKAQKLSAEGLTGDCRALLEKRVGKVTLNDMNIQSSIEKKMDSLIDQRRSLKNTAENTANGIMVSFRSKDKWAPISADWPTGLNGLDDYLAHYTQLESEGLPVLVEQFKERLNKHATQSLARIKTKLESEREDILERIDTINGVLKKTEFKQGTHLRLGSKREKYPHVQEFDRKLRSALSQIASDDHEARFGLLSDVVEELERASAPGTADNMESLRLLDPRYQMAFYAEEVNSTSNEICDVLESSSGKSGGEKESFAGTIVAASLAYVLTPDGYDRPIYSTVFLDEAFSNTAEAVSRRVLRVFKELHIHVNLITPYKNLNLARESARSLLIVERDPDLHESHLCEVTWEEIDRRVSLIKQEALMTEIQSFGVELYD